MESKRVIIINGPNLNLTGIREESIYGNKTFDEYYKTELIKVAEDEEIKLDYFQSNHEGDIVDKLHSCVNKKDYIIINPGALTHYSYSIHDAIKACNIPTIEVHMSNIFSREDWRKKSVISPASIGVISGFGLLSYKLALLYISLK